MGTKNLKKNLSNLISNGMPKKTNIAVINWGTYSKQKTVTGNLINIHEEIQKNKIKSPSIVVIVFTGWNEKVEHSAKSLRLDPRPFILAERACDASKISFIFYGI